MSKIKELKHIFPSISEYVDGEFIKIILEVDIFMEKLKFSRIGFFTNINYEDTEGIVIICEATYKNKDLTVTLYLSCELNEEYFITNFKKDNGSSGWGKGYESMEDFYLNFEVEYNRIKDVNYYIYSSGNDFCYWYVGHSRYGLIINRRANPSEIEVKMPSNSIPYNPSGNWRRVATEEELDIEYWKKIISKEGIEGIKK